MKANTVTIQSNLRDPIRIHSLGDIHGGSANCAMTMVRQYISDIANDDNGYVVGMGDYAEWIAYDDPRFHAGGIDTEIVTLENLGKLTTVYVEFLTDLFWPIRHKIIAMGTGNHEEKYQAKHHKYIAADVCENLGVKDKYTDWAAITTIQLQDGNKHADSFDIFHSHGYQGARKGGALVNGLDDLMGYMEADIYFQGHSHQYISKYKTSIYKEGDKIMQRVKVGWHTGSFLKTYEQDRTSYAERAGYPPTVLGNPTVTIFPARDGHGYVE